METALKILSWVAIVLGVMAILAGFGEINAEEASYSFVGGLLYGSLGLLSILYIKSKK